MPTHPTRHRAPLAPRDGESLERFTVRAHQALGASIKDPDKRNALIRRAWEQTKGPTEAERLARQTFDPQRYQVVRDVCVFTEHAIRDEEAGTERRFDARELAKIVRNCNERIVDAGAFPAISDGHTSDPDDEHQRDPDILGYSGGFRLGQIGRKEPRWAIFHDEYRAKDSIGTLNRKPRRSVELWTYSDTGRSHFDPIAALGATAPRLPLPVKFSRFHEGSSIVTRYSAAAVPAMAGGPNTYVKGSGRKKPTTKYQEGSCMLSPEDKAEIVDAIATLPQFQFLDKLMNSKKAMGLVEAEQPEQFAGDEDDEMLDPALEVPVDQGDELPAPEEDDLDDLLGDKPPSKFAQQHYAAKKRGSYAEKYQALLRSHQKLIRDQGQLHTQVQEMRQSTVDANRRSTLRQIESEYPHFIDAEEEAGVTLYSAGANMSDEQFDAHVARLVKYAQRSSPVTRMIPGGENPIKGSKQDYELKRSEVAVRIGTEAANTGSNKDWTQCLAEADKELRGV